MEPDSGWILDLSHVHVKSQSKPSDEYFIKGLSQTKRLLQTGNNFKVLHSTFLFPVLCREVVLIY